MGTVLGKFKNKLIITAAMMLISPTVFAADVNLSEIEITSNNNNGYNIILKTNKKTEFKKTMKNDKQLMIELKNTEATEDLSTIYNDVSNINNITVTPYGKDNLKIQIQGQDIENSNVSLEYKNTELPVESQNFEQDKINLSLPIDNYKPVYNESEIDEQEENTNLSDTLSMLNPVTIAQKIKGTDSEAQQQNENNQFKWLTYIGLAIIIITAAKNLLKPGQEQAIGLTQSLKEREKEIAKKLNAGVKETLSLRSKIAQNASAPSINYGLRSYQNSQKNPYENTSAPIRPIRKTPTTTYNQTTVKTKPQINNIKQNTQLYQRAALNTKPLAAKQSVNVDSMKFLESMTKIYEKNGRSDLAMGLRNNINKVNI